jgi:anti-anti-sigma regulatory factor
MQESTTLTFGLPEGLADALRVEFSATGNTQRFACRPLAAHSVERHTAYGVFSGQIGLSDMPDFSAAMHTLVTENLNKVILDFSGVTLTKSAVGSLVGFAAAMHGLNKRLYLFRCSPQVRAVLKELHLLPFFSFLESEDDIIAALAV